MIPGYNTYINFKNKKEMVASQEACAQTSPKKTQSGCCHVVYQRAKLKLAQDCYGG